MELAEYFSDISSYFLASCCFWKRTRSHAVDRRVFNIYVICITAVWRRAAQSPQNNTFQMTTEPQYSQSSSNNVSDKMRITVYFVVKRRKVKERRQMISLCAFTTHKQSKYVLSLVVSFVHRLVFVWSELGVGAVMCVCTNEWMLLMTRNGAAQSRLTEYVKNRKCLMPVSCILCLYEYNQ